MSLPAGAWDGHVHLFGPYDRHPLAASRSYTPPEATAEACAAHLARLGCTHAVLVQPSAYGADHTLLFEALAARPQWRGVAVLRDPPTEDLAGLRARGVRGLRFSHRDGDFAGAATLADLQALAPRLADAGLHAELWTEAHRLPDIAPVLARLPVPVVVDHMGGFDVQAGIDAPGFRSLLGLVESGVARVKLCAYRNLHGAPDFEAGRPFHRALLEAGPGALVWGSDWPHLRVDPPPDAAVLLEACRRWTDDDALMRRILFDNAAALYA